MAVFPHMDGSQFPHLDNVNVNKYVNDFDYSRYDETQMKLMLCTVPWDMGEAHIGNRTISGIGNVVYFETKEKRDSWFASIPDSECLRFESKYKELHRDLYIDVPTPFDVAAKYNYLMVEYSLFANDSSPIMYETKDGVRKWFWFVREVEYLSPSTTRLHLLDDAWQTWIYDVDITGMMLERGHAPMFATTADEFLKDPIRNNTNLLTEDVNFGNASLSKSSSEFIFNADNMYALVFTTANVKTSWGSKSANTWHTPGRGYYRLQGVPSYYVFAVAADDFDTLIENCEDDIPQFLQTIKAIAFVSADIVDIDSETFEFADVDCYNVNAGYVQNDLLKLDKSLFGFDKKYQDIAKLYTYPYSVIEVTDENGNVTEIRVEETTGKIAIESTVSLVFPWLTINAHLTGLGKTARHRVTFANVNSRTMPIQGNWYETLRSWNIPTFGITQDAGTNNDYATHFDRNQAATAASNELASANASAATAQANQNEIADNTLDNADLQTTLNTANNSVDNTYHVSVTEADTYLNTQQRAAANAFISAGVNAEIEAKDEQAAIGAASAGVTAAASVVTNLLSGDIVGAVGAAIGGGASVASTIASNNVSVNLTETEAGMARASNSANESQSNTNMNSKNTAYATQGSGHTTAANTYTEGVAANNAATTIANAARDYATNTANATRRYNTEIAAIENQIAQAKLNTPLEFGAWQNGDLATSRPMGLFANVVTQTDAAISAAGDEMLRYGYTLDKYWQFDGNWNIGKKYTYWKLKDFWVNALNVPDMYMDKLRFFLFGGVTVWRNPSDIGKTTIYDN